MAATNYVSAVLIVDGYGFAHIPTTPGSHSVEIATWRPVGSTSDQLWSFFLGATPQLKNQDIVSTAADRFRLVTCGMGTVHADVHVIVRNFDSCVEL